MNNPTETQAHRAPQFAGVQNIVQMGQFIKFSDLDDLSTIVIHTGHKASPDAGAREIWQRTNNVSIHAADPITGEQEPVQTLYVSSKQLEEGGKLYQMADSAATKKVIIHVHGDLHHTKRNKLLIELGKQAPNAQILKGHAGDTATSFGAAVAMAQMEIEAQNDSRSGGFELVFGFDGYDYHAPYIVKGLLPAESLCAIYGPSGSFKSFAAVSLACHIATGKEWDGRKVEEGSVLYVAAEGGAAVSRRIKAWSLQYNEGKAVPKLARINEPVTMGDPAKVLDLIAAAKQVEKVTGSPVQLVIIDTVARCLSGDENRAADMNAFVAACDAVKVATGATVLVVHHTGKNEENGARGSSALRGALDAEYFVKRESGPGQAFTLLCTKMKDGEEVTGKAYDLRSHVVGVDADGDDQTSLAVIATGREPAIPDELADSGHVSNNHVAMFKVIQSICDTHDGKAPWGLVIDQMKADGTWNGRNGSRWRDKLEGDDLINYDQIAKVATVLVRE